MEYRTEDVSLGLLSRYFHRAHPSSEWVFSYRVNTKLFNSWVETETEDDCPIRGRVELTFSPGAPPCILFLLLPSLDPTRILSFLYFQPQYGTKILFLIYYYLNQNKVALTFYKTKIRTSLKICEARGQNERKTWRPMQVKFSLQ